MITVQPADALLLVDIQNDFLPGGALPVPEGNAIVPIVRSYIDMFRNVPASILATRDWHPRHHCSFRPRGGPWPVHCVAGTPGAEPPPALDLPSSVVIVHKGTRPKADAYSGFQDTGLDGQLRAMGVRRLFVGGLATDYCVLHTVSDARTLGYPVYLLLDAIRAVNVNPGDSDAAEQQMVRRGAVPVRRKDLTR